MGGVVHGILSGTWSPVYSGWSVDPTGTFTWARSGNICNCVVTPTTNGQSNSTSATFTLPFPALINQRIMVLGIDGGAFLTTPSMLVLTAGSNIATMHKDHNSAAASWTNTATGKGIRGFFPYLAQ